MTDKNEDNRHKALMTALEKVQAALETLALLKLADEFYTKEERAKVYAEYDRLRDVDKAAYENLDKARKADDLTWEQRVEKYGETKARELAAPYHAAMDARRESSRAVTAFEKEHRIVLRLLDMRTTLSKGRYD
ncbi:hypothetical protein [Xanthomonas citri]|uniref:hypothetical protein n=1 Tax=Xanthomonas citri TaxID=346 RepID=UPI0001CECA58|nr:hypothetical protein [Xanthomonas citri]AMV09378.1 hypothetical protein AC028_21410 [Xanthomonas citri pv. aurantifolii]ARE58976.1 hypothetical protein TP45_21760 [Xanthomonas citri pv. aurantifolii]EFF42101.1 hypothetical protein XAUB_39800 [Xanthomonas citri pv. aurantifolii str. ICPB 11122]